MKQVAFLEKTSSKKDCFSWIINEYGHTYSWQPVLSTGQDSGSPVCVGEVNLWPTICKKSFGPQEGCTSSGISWAGEDKYLIKELLGSIFGGESVVWNLNSETAKVRVDGYDLIMRLWPALSIEDPDCYVEPEGGVYFDVVQKRSDPSWVSRLAIDRIANYFNEIKGDVEGYLMAFDGPVNSMQRLEKENSNRSRRVFLPAGD